MGERSIVGEVGDVGEKGSRSPLLLPSDNTGWLWSCSRGSSSVSVFKVRGRVVCVIMQASSSSLGRLPMLIPLSTESMGICVLPRPQRRVFGGRGFAPCLPTAKGAGDGAGTAVPGGGEGRC